MNTKEFHIHVDAKNINMDFKRKLINQHGFDYKNFIQRQDNYNSYAPEVHLTYKSNDANMSRRVYGDIQNHLEQYPSSMIGYVEYEYIPHKTLINYKDFNTDIALPFQLTFSELEAGRFRKDEIHITLDQGNSDPRLLKSLRSLGLFSALSQKDYGIAEIFTVQGSYSNIQDILPMLTTYLNQAGGAAECVIKEEIVMRYWVSSLDYKLPPVIRNIQKPSNFQLATCIG